jgi:mono/diheme cytochrome c family protein
MKHLSRWSLYCLVLMVLAAPLFVAAGGDADAGKASYNKKCATCHGKDGMAKPAMAKMFKVEMRHLGSEEVQGLGDDAMTKIIVEGQGKMKAVKGLSEADVANVVAYVRTLKQ